MSKLLVIDTETGGLDSIIHSILSLGVVVLDGNEIKDSKEWFIIEPVIHTTADAMAINHVSLDELPYIGKVPDDVIHELEAFVDQHFDTSKEKVTLGGQNVDFDVGFLQRLYKVAKDDVINHYHSYSTRFSHRTVDTASIAWFLINAGKLPLEKPSLTELFKYFKLDPPVAHTALGDALATANLFIKLRELI